MKSGDQQKSVTTPKISIRGLRIAFDGKAVLSGVDLDIEAGENLILCGASGSGKTVLAKCLLGLMTPDRGSIAIDGRETVGLSSHEHEVLLRRVGVLFQNGALFDSLPVWHNIAFGLMATGQATYPAAREMALKLLAAVGLSNDTADLLPNALSGGMQRRVALARAIAGNPQILVLDSPTEGLDPIISAHIDRLITSSLSALKATALTITHNIESARRVGAGVAFLHDGRIRWRGVIADLDRSGDAALNEFLRRSPGA